MDLTPEALAERERCVRFIRALVREWRKSAARVQEDGTHEFTTWHWTKPHRRTETFVRPRYAEYAKHILECAGALEDYVKHLEGGAVLKKEFEAHDAGVPTDATEPKPWE